LTLSKPTKIFLINFTIIIIGITILAIYYTNKHSVPVESKVIVDSSVGFSLNDSNTDVKKKDTAKGIDVDGTYDVNGIIYDYEKSTTSNGYSYTYPVISGLRDQSVEEDINKQITDKINKIAESTLFTSKAKSNANANIKAEVVSNFANTISIKLTATMTDTFSKNYGINFNLRNGARVRVADLFVGSAPEKNIVSGAAYKSFATKYVTEDGISNDFYNNIDSEILNFMMAFDSGKVAEFSYTPLSIELYKDGKTVKIDMTEHPEYFAIYSRFETDNDLYAYNDRVAKNVPNLTQRPECIYDLYEKVNDFCYLDVCILKDPKQTDGFTTSEMQTIKNFKQDFEDRLEAVKEYSGIYYSNYVTVTRKNEDDKRILVFEENEKYIILDKASFKSQILSKILELERDILNENQRESKISLIDNPKIEKYINQTKYRVDSGKEIVEEREEEEQPEERENQHEERENQHEEEPGTENENQPEGQNQPVPSQPSPTTSQAPSPSPTSSVAPSPSPSEFTTQVYF